MPLVQYVGNASAQDNTEVIRLDQAPDGSQRTLLRGKRGLVSGQELRNLVASFQIEVIEMGTDLDLNAIPTEMPDGYDENGYKAGESPTDVVYTPAAYPDPEDSPDAAQATQVASVSPSAAQVPAEPAVPTPSADANPSPAASSSPSTSSGASDSSSSASSSSAPSGGASS